MPDSPLICSVVLTWNNFEDTDECLRSLVAQTYPNHRILVVDNGSSDGSRERLQERWQDRVTFLLSKSNLGCGGGYAFGIREALSRGATFVAIVDNDTAVAPELIERLVEPFDEASDVGMAAPIMTFYDNPDRVWFAAGSYNALLGITRHTGLNLRVATLGDLKGRVYETGYAPSCAVLMSRPALEQAGLPDERFVFGHDDIDWCLRAKAKGFRTVVVGEALVRHKVSTTGGVRGSTALTAFSAFHHAKGSMLLGAKHAPGWRLAPYLFGQVFLRLPYYSVGMLRAGRLTGPLAYVLGLISGVRYLLPRGL